MDPFSLKPQKQDKIFTSWNKVFLKPYDKNEVDPYTRTRIILMSGTEFESVRLQHSFSRMCANNDIRRRLACMRRGEQLQQKRVAGLKPADEGILEHTIGYEQLAVDLTANLAVNEKNGYVKKQLDFALLEDFDHLYRYADLMELEKCGDPTRLVGDYTEIMPGRPTVAEYRHPFDDVSFYLNGYLSDLKTKLAVNIITAAEQQTMNFYMNVANLYTTPLGRKLFNEIAMIEEQHVTGYGCLKDPCMTPFENLLMNEYTECYLYYSCYEDETDERIKGKLQKWVESKGFCQTGVTINDLSKQIGINRTYLSKHINECYSCNFNCWINKLRVREAEEMMRRNPDLPLSDVAEQVGYADISHFSRQFKYIKGEPPSLYGKKIRQTSDLTKCMQ